MKLIAYTVKGLEKIVKEEIIEQFDNVEIDKIGDKFVIFSINDNYINKKNSSFYLRTADDIGFLVKEINKPKRISTEELVKDITEVNYTKYENLIAKLRKFNNVVSFTLSIVNVKINKEEFIKELANHFKLKYLWHYSKCVHTNFDIRIFLNRKVGFISIRIPKEPLYHRDYKVKSTIGALKPSIASAMVWLATTEFRKNNNMLYKQKYIVDNFCGSGTILCEAVINEYSIAGGDIKKENINITKQNLRELSYPIDALQKYIKNLDATNTPWDNNIFDSAVSNLPWNKQVEVKRITELYVKTLEEYKRILKPNTSLILLVHKPQILIKYAKKYFSNHKIETIKISFKGQNPTIVFIKV